MPLIDLVATGGTIASRSGVAGRQATVRADELLSTLGSVPRGVEVRARDVATKGSYAFGTADLLGLVREVRSALDGDADGIVLTHGTDAMEETAFLLDLTHDDARPVVLTGAQRPFDDAAPDGPANLADAVAVAAAPAARDCGVLLAFDGFAFPARGVRKTDTLSAHAFAAPGRGPAFRIAAGRPIALARPHRPAPLALDLDRPDLPRVDVVSAYPGADGVHVRASLAAGAAGLVVAALGVGNAGPALVEAVADAVAVGVPVLICSRGPAGPVAPLYAGGGAALERAGAVFADDLSPWQARLLLAVASAVPDRDAATVVRSWLAA
jgi:L-asparaginase